MKKSKENWREAKNIKKHKSTLDFTLSQMSKSFSSFDFARQLRKNNPKINTGSGICSLYLQGNATRISCKTWERIDGKKSEKPMNLKGKTEPKRVFEVGIFFGLFKLRIKEL